MLSDGKSSDVPGVNMDGTFPATNFFADMVESRREFRTVYYKLKKSPVVEVMKDRINHYENI
jgi:hypothetical protein